MREDEKGEDGNGNKGTASAVHRGKPRAWDSEGIIQRREDEKGEKGNGVQGAV